MVGTGAVVDSAQAQQDRSVLHAVLERQEVQVQLVALGVDPRQAHVRVNALSDGEARDLARHMDQMPAGGLLASSVVLIGVIVLVSFLIALMAAHLDDRDKALRY